MISLHVVFSVLFSSVITSQWGERAGLYDFNAFVCLSSALLYGPRQANLVLIAYASSEGSGEPAHPRSLARTFAARSYK